jgi:hypothetical protein
MSVGTPSDSARSATRLSAAALVWSAGLVLAALVWPAYSTSAMSGDGVTLGHATLVQAHGAGALLLMAIPLVMSGVVLAAMRMRRAGVRWAGWAGVASWTAIGVLAIESVAGIATIGLFILPVPILLAIATRRDGRPASTPTGRRSRGRTRRPTRPASRSDSLSGR